MFFNRTAGQLFLISIVCGGLHAAESIPSAMPPGPEWAAEEAQTLPIVRASSVSPVIAEAQLAIVRRAQILMACKVAPLNEIEDAEALAFENDSQSAAIDIGGLRPSMALALEDFKELVTSVGGSFDLKSAYRPPAYQAHLQEVWVKWVKQLRNNRTAGCRALREEVGAEFAHHQLLVRQQPVTTSDHTLGLAFDAAVAMPRGARLNRRRVSVDRLALLAGIKRPNGRRDPVHFRLLRIVPALDSD